MLNYIKAELYRNFNRAYFWVYTGFMAIFPLIINIFIKTTKFASNMNLTVLFEFANAIIIAAIYFVLPMVDIATAEEEKNLTLKNVAAFGVSRNKLIMSKVIVATILSIIASVIILTVFFGSGTILFGVGQSFTLNIALDFMRRLSAATILWIGAISVCTFLAFVIKNNNVFAFVYAGIFSILGIIILLLSKFVSDKFQYIYNILITTQLKNLTRDDLTVFVEVTNSQLSYAALVGIIYTIVFIGLTMMYVKNKEIK
ncbi:ABC transporter permease [uncultured Clostridium sp.]|uniref:ABC transporter permease n=1 Tax=uncultured Clostridium sp. TaxID=59620 RepID=UPI0028E8CEB7|nr:ABC transporter permease [uncultured Clostridium sp.]